MSQLALLPDDAGRIDERSFDRPVRARRSGRDTERAAADRVASHNINGFRYSVLEALERAGNAGLTDYEISRELGVLRTSAGKRRKELYELGLCQDTDERRATDTGASAIVWRINSKGREVLMGASA